MEKGTEIGKQPAGPIESYVPQIHIPLEDNKYSSQLP